MATTIEEPKIGSHIYMVFRPQRPGTIIEVVGPQPHYFYIVKIKWIDGTVTEESTMGLRDFDALIEDHKKKLNTHLKALEKLEKL